MRRYKLYDVYEGKKLLVKTDSFSDVIKACAERCEDTDGKFEPALYEFDGCKYVQKGFVWYGK